MNLVERVKTCPTQPRDRRAQMLNLSVEHLDNVQLGYPRHVLDAKQRASRVRTVELVRHLEASRRRVATAVSLTTPLVNSWTCGETTR